VRDLTVGIGTSGVRAGIAQDVCFKIQLKRYGGFGFDHILESGLPYFRSLGVTEEQIQTILVDNPRRVLAGGERGR
jgi:phosphotriesterase-related protein